MLKLQQREVEVAVDTCDRGGNFIGALYLSGVNFAITLVEAGFATVYGADRLPYHAELVAAQGRAQQAAKFIWSPEGGLPARQQKRDEASRMANPSALVPAPINERSWIPISVTAVSDGLNLSINHESEEAAAERNFVAEALRQPPFTGDALPHSPCAGELVAVYYKSDKTWNRAKVISVSAHAALVQFFGLRDNRRGQAR